MNATEKTWRRIRVYAAGASASGHTLDADVFAAWRQRLAAALGLMSGGGCTVIEARGCWRGQAEPTVILETLVVDAVWRSPARLVFAREVQRFLAETCQESVLITAEWLGSDVEFVTRFDGEGVVSCD